MARLPQPGSDDGIWGDVLNEYLKVSHTDDGSLKIVPVESGGTGGSDANSARFNLGLGNVDNTADVDKPISSSIQAVLDNKYDASNPDGFTSYNSSSFNADLLTKTTDDLVQGSNNHYSQWDAIDSNTIQYQPTGSNYSKIIVKSQAAQTENLQEWQNNSGTILANVSHTGVLSTIGLNVSSNIRTTGVILVAPNETEWLLTVDDDGTLTTTEL